MQHADIDHTGITGVGGAGLTASESFLAANVSITPADTYVDVVSLSLAAGTWLIWGNVLAVASVAGHWEVKLHDGAGTVYHNPEQYILTTSATFNIEVFAKVVLGSTTTIRVAACRDAGSGTHTVIDTAAVNGTADKGTKILALQIA